MEAIFRMHRDTLDAEGQPVAVHESGSEPLSIRLPESVIARIRDDGDSVTGQALYAYVSGGANVDIPTVKAVSLRLTESEVLGILAQYAQSVPQHCYPWVWSDSPTSDPLLDSWLLTGSRSLVLAVTGYEAEVKLPSAMAVRASRSRALATLDDMVADVHRQHKSRTAPPVVTLLEWFVWLESLKASHWRTSHYQNIRSTVLNCVTPALDGLATQWDVPDTSYQSRYMLDTRRQRLAPLGMFRHRLVSVYPTLNKVSQRKG